MAAEWRPDPLARAQLRYHDGANWTHHVADDGVSRLESADLPLTVPVAKKVPPPPPTLASSTPPPPDPATLFAAANPVAPGYPAWALVPQRKGGRLIAAGILGIISAILGFLACIGYFALLNLPPHRGRAARTPS
jgi:hypothetical protein